MATGAAEGRRARYAPTMRQPRSAPAPNWHLIALIISALAGPAACGGAKQGDGWAGYDSGGVGGGGLGSCAPLADWAATCALDAQATTALLDGCAATEARVAEACGEAGASTWADAEAALYDCYTGAAVCEPAPDSPAAVACAQAFTSATAALSACLTDGGGGIDTGAANVCEAPDPIAFEPGAPLSEVVALNDDDVILIASDLSVPWFDERTSGEVWLSANGLISLGGPLDGCCFGGALPSADGADGLIALGWADLDPSQGGTLSFQIDGEAPSRRLRVRFDGVPTHGGGGALTAEARLNEADGAVELHVGEAALPEPATIGVEALDGSRALCLPEHVAQPLSVAAWAARFTPAEHSP